MIRTLIIDEEAEGQDTLKMAMRAYFFVLAISSVLFLSGLPLYAQPQEKIDSLKNLLKATGQDTNRVILYGRLCWLYVGTRSKTDIARKYTDSLSILAEELKYENGIAKSHFYYGVIDRFEGNHAQALAHLLQYVEYSESKGDSSRVAGGLYQVGIVHSHLGNYDKSLSAYYRAIAIEEKDNNHYSVGYMLNAIGIIFRETKKYEDAIEQYNKALSIFDSLDAKEDKSTVLVNLANIYSELEQFDKAKQYYKQALHIDYEIGKMWGVAMNLANTAYMFDKMKRYDSALVYHLQALDIRETYPEKDNIARSLIAVGYGYAQLQNYAVAKTYLFKAIAQAKEIKAKPLQRDAYENLSNMYAAEKDFSKAFEYHQLYSLLKDSVLNEISSQQLNELQTKYETAEKDKQITLLAKEKEIQAKEAQRQATLKRTFVGGLIAVIILAALVVLILRQRLKNQKLLAAKNEEIKEVNFKQQLSELEMKALRAQINPHFLFNCMNSINRMILNNETEDASRYLTKFSKLVRLILENSETPTVSLGNELAMLESYIQLEALRFKGKINYQIVLDGALEPESTYLPSMVLQPFVENAIWHGLMHKESEDKGMITIAIREEEDRLLCTIEDNGVGREKAHVLSEKSVLKSKSLGMKITEERLRLLSKKQLEKLINITDLKDSMNQALGTRVDIMVPIS